MRAALREIALFMPRLVRLVGGLATDRRLSGAKRARIGLAAGYLASPIDLIPDWIPVLGQVDDLIVAAILLDSLFDEVPEEILHAHWRGPRSQLDLMRRLAGLTGWVVPSGLKRRVGCQPPGA